MQRRMLSVLALAATCGYPGLTARAQTPAAVPPEKRVVVVGFLGAFDHPRNQRKGMVRIASRLEALGCADAEIAVASGWRWNRVYKSIRRLVDDDANGRISEAEIARTPTIVAYGHSLGGWAVIKLAEKLGKERIPVALTVQVDSVGIGDEVVPANVRAAANFYQRGNWFLRGENRIRTQDSERTTLLGNFFIRHVGHLKLSRDTQVSDFITEAVGSRCQRATATAPGVPPG